MTEQKEIWVPVGETNVTVRDGTVTVVETMVMKPRPVSKPKTGFREGPE